MSLSLGQFGYLPWMQRGLINKVSQVQDAPTDLERVSLNVTVGVTAGMGGGVISKNVKLIGPGDILGVDPQMVVNTTPDDGVFNFDDNLMATIEFSEVDFPWRYTPARANSLNQLNPWLALIVLKDSEIEKILEPLADGMPPVLVLAYGGDYEDIFHPASQHWAWGHVQVNSLYGSPPITSPVAFEHQLAVDPLAGVARVICPRRLAPATEYTAFLIPAFETGRIAGSGVAIPLAGISSLAPSWGTGTILNDDYNKFPVYYSWRFGTSALGDFETLARALVPRPMEETLGGVKMDISNSGMGLNALFSPPATETTNTVQMEGALAPATFSPPAPLTLADLAVLPSPPLAVYANALKNILNLATDVRDATYSPAAHNNPFVPATFASDDPVILPPIYGQWHANAQRIDTTLPSYDWLQELNMDARYRAAAGLGARAVIENKQNFMEQAWNQIGEVLAVNDKINKALLALQTSRQMYIKHVIANTKISSSSASTPQSVSHTANIGASFFKKVKTGSSFTSFAANSMYNTASRSQITKATVNSGFRKVTRGRVASVSKMNLKVANKALPAQVASPTSVVKAADKKMSEPLSTAVMSSFAVTAGGSAAAVIIYNTTYLASHIMLQHMLAKYDGYAFALHDISTVAINASAFVSNMQTALDPAVTITARVKQQIALQYDGVLEAAPFQRIMAYPVMDEPAYQHLIKMSTEYLLPNLDQYPNNSVTLLRTNSRFLESYMVGLNHQFSKELLWNGYPTDQRGSYFRRFWDINDTLNPLPSPPFAPDFMYDIDRIHNWTNKLGRNNTGTRYNGLPSNFLVLMIKGDLLKKYPNALIYAQKAVWAHASPPSPPPPPNSHTLYEGSDLYTSSGGPNSAYLRFPLFKATVKDMVLVGFSLQPAEAIGSLTESPPPGSGGPPGEPGWFFVFRERPGQVAFGMSDAVTAPPASPPWPGWDYINWGHMRNGGGVLYPTARVDLSASNPVSIFNGMSTSVTHGYHWHTASNAAEVASIVFRDPVLVAIHAESLVYL